jgi:hypothetical protein
MNKLTFLSLLGGFSLSALGCAESAIGEPTDDPMDPPLAEQDDLDATVEPGSSTPRDGSTPRPDASTASDGAVSETRDAASSADSGFDAGTRDAGPADAGHDPPVVEPPPVVDAGPPPLVCSSGQTTCGDVCVNTTNDTGHCGACGKSCASDQMCQASQCVGGVPDFDVPAGCSKKKYGGHGYAFCSDALAWRDARSACLSAKLDLAIVTDRAENDFVKANGDSWIAVNDLILEGRYVQVLPGNSVGVTGTAVSYTNWRNGEPNNTIKCLGLPLPGGLCAGTRTDEDCTLLNGGDGAWSDTDCTDRRGFVCEMY